MRIARRMRLAARPRARRPRGPLGDRRELLGGQRLQPQVDVVHHQGDGRTTVWPDNDRVSLDDVDFRLEQSRADLEERLGTVRQFHPNQIALNDRQTGAFEDFPSLFRVAQQEPHKRAFRGIADRESHDPHGAAFKPPHDLEKLADAVLQEDGELAYRGIVPPRTVDMPVPASPPLLIAGNPSIKQRTRRPRLQL